MVENNIAGTISVVLENSGKQKEMNTFIVIIMFILWWAILGGAVRHLRIIVCRQRLTWWEVVLIGPTAWYLKALEKRRG